MLVGVLEPKLRYMRSVQTVIRHGPSSGPCVCLRRQDPQNGVLIYVHDESSSNIAQIAVPVIGLGINVRSHPP